MLVERYGRHGDDLNAVAKRLCEMGEKPKRDLLSRMERSLKVPRWLPDEVSGTDE
jgi:hypothetical protein